MPQPTRRAMITATSAVVLSASSFADAENNSDPARLNCLRYVAMEDKIFSLFDEWAILESRLARAYPEFLGLPLEKQVLFPGGLRFLEIDRELKELDSERRRLLPLVVENSCQTQGALIAKLMVVERLLKTNEQPDAHALIVNTIKDLARLKRLGNPDIVARTLYRLHT